VSELLADGGRVLAAFAGVGNTDGVRHLLDLGVTVGALFAEGDGYLVTGVACPSGYAEVDALLRKFSS
jgi:hypothetical protein